MGFVKDIKAEALAKDAQKAWDNGRGYFAPVMYMPVTHADQSSGIDDWAAMLDAVTAVGWHLQHWAVTSDKKDRPQALPLFVR